MQNPINTRKKIRFSFIGLIPRPVWYSSRSLWLHSAQMETDKLSMTNRWHGLFHQTPPPPPVPSDDKCNSELQQRRLRDNSPSPAFQALSQYHSSLKWFSIQFVSIFQSRGQDSRSGCPPLLLIQGVPQTNIYYRGGCPKRPFLPLSGGRVASCAVGPICEAEPRESCMGPSLSWAITTPWVREG